MDSDPKPADPFGGNRWTSANRWMDGSNARLVYSNMRSVSDYYLRGSDPYESQLETAQRTLAGNRSTFDRFPAIDHVAIAKSGESGKYLYYCVYLKPDSQPGSTDGLPPDLRAIGPDGADLGYNIPVTSHRLDGSPALFGYCGGDEVVGDPLLQGVCGFVFEEKAAQPGREKRKFFVTNSHILVEPDQDPVERECNHFGQVLGRVSTGATLSSRRVNSMDAALVRLGNVPAEPLRINGQSETIVDQDDIRLGSSDRFSYVAGRSVIECHNPRLVAPPETGTASYGAKQLQFTGFWKLTPTNESNTRPAPGHSGAILFTRGRGGLIIRGLVFAGIPNGSEVWVYAYSDMARVLFRT